MTHICLRLLASCCRQAPRPPHNSFIKPLFSKFSTKRIIEDILRPAPEHRAVLAGDIECLPTISIMRPLISFFAYAS